MKSRVLVADGGYVASFSAETWVLLGLIAAVGIGAILNTWAKSALMVRQVHELKSRVEALRTLHASKDGAASDEQIIEV